jgi:hypothetical protein
MIRHQTISMTDPAVTRYDLSESLKKQLAVAVVEKDLLARITPTSEMINCAGKIQPKRPCHGAPFQADLSRGTVDSNLRRRYRAATARKTTNSGRALK